ncbi:MAG: T9SS type A sorting domain-containing protein [Flavobacteriales bacterium]|nr:T9SS type A sorting domain-containing protein [Flavobacteriales bacterium]
MQKFFILSVLLGIFHSSTAQLPVIQWLNAEGSVQNDNAHAVCTDSYGNSYITGGFRGTVDFNPSTLNTYLTPSGNDVFIVKYAPDGSLIWAKKVGGSGDDHGRSIIVDDQQNIYVGGYFSGTCDFDPGSGTMNESSLGGMDLFILKMNPEGETEWVYTKGLSDTDICYDMTFDSFGNIIYTGVYGLSSLEAIIGAVDELGMELWYHTLGSIDWDNGYDVNADGNGNSYVSGKFTNTVDFDPSINQHTSTSNGGIDSFIVKFDAQGNYIQHTSIGGDGDDYLFTTVDNDGMIYFCGHSSENIVFEIGNSNAIFQPNSGIDIFYGKLDSAFGFVWMKQIGGTGDDKGQIIDLDGSGNPIIVGPYHSSLDFISNSELDDCITNGNDDCFVFKTDTDGNFIWSTSFGSPNADWPYSLSVENNHIFVAGWLGATTTYNSVYGLQEYNAFGMKDIFTVKILTDAINTNQEIALCPGTSVQVGESTYSEPGTYVDILTSNSGADSIVTTTITTFESTPIVIESINNTLYCNTQSGSYQWYNCIPELQPIEGANAQSFQPDGSGSYCVALLDLTCADTSDCVSIELCSSVTTSQSIVLCKGDAITVGSSTYTEAGIYTDVLINTLGCDSIVHTTIVENETIDVDVQISNNNLLAIPQNATYQWLDCDNNYTPIPEATNNYFHPTSSGHYAVEITIGQCSDTSICHEIILDNLLEIRGSNGIQIFPNPTNSDIQILSNFNGEIFITDVTGRLIVESKIFKGKNTLSLEDKPSGTYSIQVISTDHKSSHLIVVTH